RQAISLALNRKAYLSTTYSGEHVQLARGYLHPSLWAFDKKLSNIEFNHAKAKKLLAQAGFPQGFSTELWTLPINRPYMPDGKKLGEMMQADLAKIGVKVSLLTYDWPTYLE